MATRYRKWVPVWLRGLWWKYQSRGLHWMWRLVCEEYIEDRSYSVDIEIPLLSDKRDITPSREDKL